MLNETNKIEIIKFSLKRFILTLSVLSIFFFFALICLFVDFDRMILHQCFLLVNFLGWLFVSVSFISELLISKYLGSIVSNYKKIESSENKEIAKLFLISYMRFFNPFSNHCRQRRDSFIDVLGFSLYSIIPIITFLIGITFFQTKNTVTMIILVVAGFIIGLLERIDRRYLNKQIFLIVPDNEKNKRYTSVIFGIVLFCILYFLLGS